MRVKSWVSTLASHRTIATVVCLAVLLGIPSVAAALHRGFPTTEVSYDTHTVWVTNGDDLQAGRLNDRIDELDASVAAASHEIDVLQDSSSTYLVDADNGTLERVDPAFVTLVDRVDIPQQATVSYGGDTIAVLSPQGSLWVLDASGRLDFDSDQTEPDVDLSADSAVVVAKTGVTFVVDAEEGTLYRFERPGSEPQTSDVSTSDDVQLTTVGDQAVILDRENNSIVTGDGEARSLPDEALAVQQPGPDNDRVLVAGTEGLMFVSLTEETVTEEPFDSEQAASHAAAPVWLDGCAYAAWPDPAQYLAACDGDDATVTELNDGVATGELAFRVNHGVIALNDVRSGNVWVVTSDMRLVSNWQELKPDETEKEGDDGEEKPVVESFEDTVAHRTETNHAPEANDDEFGLRPGRTTILPVLMNDTDEDGDVLTISSLPEVSESQGKLELVEGDRALQFTPAEDMSGTVSFRYTAADGRGASDSAQVNASIVPPERNHAPESQRISSLDVALDQTAEYNVLADWLDPDGDGIYLVGAASSTDDDVSFTADGTITFTSTTGMTGSKEVTYTVSDGDKSAKGTLDVTVKPPDEVGPVAVPDSARGFVGRDIVVRPLDNDRAPVGSVLNLVSAEVVEGGEPSVSVDSDAGTVTVNASSPGTSYLEYTIEDGDDDSVGIIRVDAAGGGDDDSGPVAVKDTAFVRAGEPVEVPVLDNDYSPSGDVLVVTEVDKPTKAHSLNVETLGASVVRITAPQVLSEQVQLTYTVSDGKQEATAAITVVPLPPLVKHNSPVAVDDMATVRAGDVATVDVLDNDYSPDGVPLTLEHDLVKTDDIGDGAEAFVSGDTVRYKAPTQPGRYTLTYGVTDKYHQRATASVGFTVMKADDENRAPHARDLTARVFSGGSVTVDVPLDGLDADGDSVYFAGIDDEPELGGITGSTSTSFVYEADPGASGTDTFDYTVVDAYGDTATATIRIGVAERAETDEPPVAVNDLVEIEPGKKAFVPVLDNDSDPNGYPIAVEDDLVDVEDGIEAQVTGDAVVVSAPDEEGAFMVQYRIKNGHGGSATAFVQVVVTEEATPRYPTAVDKFVPAEDLVDHDTADVDVYEGAFNPSGAVKDLEVGVTGSFADVADVSDDGVVTVTPSDERMAITYSLTDPETTLAAQAFIVVPPQAVIDELKHKDDPQNRPDDGETGEPSPTPTPTPDYETTPPPHINDGLGTIVVPMNGSESWSLSDLVSVPSGRSASIVPGSASVSRGEVSADASALSFTAKKDFRGDVAVSFTVNDGPEEGESEDRLTELSFPLVVGKEDQSDIAPTFTSQTVEVEAGAAKKAVSLREMTDHPNPKVLRDVTYSDMSISSDDVSASLEGDELTLSTPLTTKPETTAKVTFTYTSHSFTKTGTLDVVVAASSKPVATQKAPPQERSIQRGDSVTIDDAVGGEEWINPFPDKDLTIIDAVLANDPSGVSVSHTDSSVTVTSGSAAEIGTVGVAYKVQDATKTTARVVTGQLAVTIHDRPSQANTLTSVNATDAKATMKLTKAPANNGRTIDKYRVSWKGGTKEFGADELGNKWTITGLTNGKAYTFTVAAHNADGWGKASAASAKVTPYGTPAKVANPKISAGKHYTTTATMSWKKLTGADTGGGAVTYEYSFNGGKWKSTKSTSASVKITKAGTYSFKVRAKNNGSGKRSGAVKSNSVKVTKKPPPPPTVSVKKGGKDPWNGTGLDLICGAFKNLPAGDYTATMYLNGSNADFETPSYGFTLTSKTKGSGHVCVGAYLGVRFNDKVELRITGDKSATGSTTNWDALSPHSSWHYGLNK